MKKKIPKPLIPIVLLFILSVGYLFLSELRENTNSKGIEEVINDSQQSLKNIEKGYSIANNIQTIAKYIAIITFILSGGGLYLYFRRDYTYI